MAGPPDPAPAGRTVAELADALTVDKGKNASSRRPERVSRQQREGPTPQDPARTGPRLPDVSPEPCVRVETSRTSAQTSEHCEEEAARWERVTCQGPGGAKGNTAGGE